MTTLLKVTTFETTNLQPHKLIHTNFDFYNVNSIQGLISMINVVCTKTRMIWVFPDAHKRVLVQIIRFILKKFNNEQHTCIYMRVEEDGALGKSIDVTNLIVDDFNIAMENTGNEASLLTGKNEINNTSIYNMVRSGLIDSNKDEKKVLCSRKIS